MLQMWKIQILLIFSSFGEIFAVQPFPLNRAILRQSDTVNTYGAFLAVDHRLETFAVAEASSEFVEWKDVAWWMADLGHRHRILVVVVAATDHPIYSAYLDNFSVDLLVNSVAYDPTIPGSYQCGKWDSPFKYKTGFRFAFRCSLYYYRRYVLIRRLDIPFTYQTYMAIAEIEVMVDIAYVRN